MCETRGGISKINKTERKGRQRKISFTRKKQWRSKEWNKKGELTIILTSKNTGKGRKKKWKIRTFSFTRKKQWWSNEWYKKVSNLVFYAQSTITVISGQKTRGRKIIVQELCESRGGRPELSVLTSFLVSVDVKNYRTMLRHWSQLVPNMSTDIWGH